MPVKLIFHIGAGKTGTSSIQATLKDSAAALAQRGVWYLGLVLEHAPCLLHKWQKFGATDVLHKLSQEEGEVQIYGVLHATVVAARAAGVHTLIWSSESFFDRPDKALPALSRLSAEGVQVQIVAYIRRHDLWARSAYIQWGIKHKTLPGKIRPFGTWVARRKPVFSPSIKKYLVAFPGAVFLRNFDAAGDSVADFFKFCQFEPEGLSVNQSNVTGSDAETLLRALLNDQIEGVAFPKEFNRQIGRHSDFTSDSTIFFKNLLPTSADLQGVLDSATEDRAYINRLLARSGQAELSSALGVPEDFSVNRERLLLLLASILMAQANALAQLEAKWRDLAAARKG